MMTGADLGIVPYRSGGPALRDLIAGVVRVYIGPASASIDHVRAGKLRALAVTTATRSASLPDISAMAEFLPGYEASTFFGVGAPMDTHAEVIDKLNTVMCRSCRSHAEGSALPTWEVQCFPTRPADLGKLLVEESEKWVRVIIANIKGLRGSCASLPHPLPAVGLPASAFTVTFGPSNTVVPSPA